MFTTSTDNKYSLYNDINPIYHEADTFTFTGNSNSILINNSNIMNQQVKVAVFKVKRNKQNQIISSTFIDEMWIEDKPGVSIDFAVAKKLANKYEADEIVIKQIYTVTL